MGADRKQKDYQVDRVLTSKQLRSLIPYSMSQITRLEAAGNFPARIKLGPGRVGWSENEVKEWLEQKKRERKRQDDQRTIAPVQ